MKKSILLSLGLALASCGNQSDSSEVSTSPKKPGKVIELKPAAAKIQTVTARSMDSRDIGGMESIVTLQFEPGCLNTISPVQYRYEAHKNGTIDLFVSAYEQVSTDHLAAFCAEVVRDETRDIIIPFYVDQNDINLINLEGPSVKAPNDFNKLSMIGAAGVHVSSVEPLCPEGVVCITNGSVITLAIDNVGCLDETAVTYKPIVRKNGDKLDLSVAAFNVHRETSKRARCIVAPTSQVTITTIGVPYALEDVKLQVMSSLAK